MTGFCNNLHHSMLKVVRLQSQKKKVKVQGPKMDRQNRLTYVFDTSLVPMPSIKF